VELFGGAADIALCQQNIQRHQQVKIEVFETHSDFRGAIYIMNETYFNNPFPK
jgi:hypothetical protein